jgi:hypothetical protein
LPPEVLDTTHNDETASAAAASSTISADLLWKKENSSPTVYYAKTLMDLGEYAHAAATLSQPSLSKSKVESMPAPLANLSPFAFYLRAYALYMAGERRKEEDHLELKGYV